MSNNRKLVDSAIALLANQLKEHFAEAILDAMNFEEVSETLLALQLISDEEAGEILAEGIFAAMHEAFDATFSLGNEGEEESDVEVCATCGSELEDGDEEETNPVY